jgi:uncharacterized delta-60 repeat protein
MLSSVHRPFSRLIAVAAVLLASAVAAPAALAAAPGTLDTGFGAQGWSTVTQPGRFGGAGAVVVQGDGRIVTAGMLEQDNGKDVVMATRMLPDGSLDPTFANGGVLTLPVGIGACGNTLRLQPDGKIVIAGTGDVGGKMVFLAVRLNANGTPDATFGTGGVASAAVGAAAIANGVAIQGDGKILLGGTARTVLDDPTTNAFAIARLNADGSLDTRYGNGGSAMFGGTGGAWGVALQSDGKAVLGGQATVNGTEVFQVVRVATNGRADTRFANNGIYQKLIGTKAIANAIAVQPDDKVVVTGNAFDGRGVAATLRLTTKGTPDPTFGSGGVSEVTLWQAVNGMALQRDGKIVLASTGSTTVRLTAGGAADATFGTGGLATHTLGSPTAANGVAVQADGKLVLAGTTTLADGTRPLIVYRIAG